MTLSSSSLFLFLLFFLLPLLFFLSRFLFLRFPRFCLRPTFLSVASSSSSSSSSSLRSLFLFPLFCFRPLFLLPPPPIADLPLLPFFLPTLSSLFASAPKAKQHRATIVKSTKYVNFSVD